MSWSASRAWIIPPVIVGLAASALFFVAVRAVHANDAAASTAVGGIELRHEARISMERERLTVSVEKITVEYEFLNETDQDIETEVAFPVPPYGLYFTDPAGSRGIVDFRLWTESREIRFQTQVKATLRGIDYTELLNRLHVDPASFGHFDDSSDPVSRDVSRLEKAKRAELIKAGLIDDEARFPNWTVVKTYHWAQTFPAHKVLHVRHEYRPVVGFEQVTASAIQGKENPQYARLPDACMNADLRNRLVGTASKHDGYVPTAWVDYILTTANTWKKPIKHFDLTVQVVRKPENMVDGNWLASFCWDGPIQQVTPETFHVGAENFVPSRELRVMLFRAGD